MTAAKEDNTSLIRWRCPLIQVKPHAKYNSGNKANSSCRLPASNVIHSYQLPDNHAITNSLFRHKHSVCDANNEDIGRHDVICTCAEGPAALICQGDSVQNLHHRQPYFLHHHEELPLSMQKPTMSLVAPCRQSQQVCVPLNKNLREILRLVPVQTGWEPFFLWPRSLSPHARYSRAVSLQTIDKAA